MAAKELEFNIAAPGAKADEAVMKHIEEFKIRDRKVIFSLYVMYSQGWKDGKESK